MDDANERGAVALSRSTRQVAIVVALFVVLLVAGNYVYWVGEGSPGTPAQLRARVSEAGLEVVWSNNGPRGGDGFVETSCGRTVVSVSEAGAGDESLWLLVDGTRAELTASVVEALVHCAFP